MSGLTDAGITSEQLAQMQGSGPGGGMTTQDAQNMKQKQQEQEGQRQEMLTRLMAPEAKERLNRISLVKPDKVRTHPSSAHRRCPLTCAARAQARKLEDMVLMMAQRNQLREALSDSQLKQMLEQISDSVRRIPVHLLHPRCERLTAAAPRSTQLHTPALHSHCTHTRTPCGRAVRVRVRPNPNPNSKSNPIPNPSPNPNPNPNPNPLRQGAGGETRSTVVIDRRRMANDDSDSDVSLDGL